MFNVEIMDWYHLWSLNLSLQRLGSICQLPFLWYVQWPKSKQCLFQNEEFDYKKIFNIVISALSEKLKIKIGAIWLAWNESKFQLASWYYNSADLV